MQNTSYQIYGVTGLDDIKTIARETADKYQYGANRDNLYKMLLETAIVETDAGNAYMDTNRNYGRSIMQFDKVGYNEALRIRASKGKYIVFLEGDDYWIDEGKIQKQLDFTAVTRFIDSMIYVVKRKKKYY